VERCLALAGGSLVGPALDVACGTGLSTRALAELGFRVVGFDLTPAMVAVARKHERLPFAVAAAERLPVREKSAALMTVGSGLHWFEASRFLGEAVRVLAPGGVLLVYEHAGIALGGDERFSAWIGEIYLSRYPSPPTPGRFLGSLDAPEGLAKVASESWDDTVAFAHDELVAYFLTQGNVSGPIDAKEVSVEDARQWLLDKTAPFFLEASRRDFSFLATANLFVAEEGSV
jgi:SAM-dependent methyltransferase